MIKVVKRYEKSTFDNFLGNEKLVNILKNIDMLDTNVYIYGGVGLGKTHLAYSLLNDNCEIKTIDGEKYYFGNKVFYASIKSIIDSIRSDWKNKSFNSRVYSTIPILIIDEIGVQYGTESERIELYEIINNRYNNVLPTIAISNLDDKQLVNILGLRIVDRLLGGAKVFKLEGESKR